MYDPSGQSKTSMCPDLASRSQPWDALEGKILFSLGRVGWWSGSLELLAEK